MEFIFWQNMISLHQSAFLRELAINHTVVLVVQAAFEAERGNCGWSIPDLRNVSIIVGPSKQKIRRLVTNYRDAVHVFTGFSAYPMVYQALREAIQAEVHPILVYAEPFRTGGFKGMLRMIRYKWLAWRFNKHIRGLLAMGEMGMKRYASVGFSQELLYEWAYFTEQRLSEVPLNPSASFSKPNLLYVGQLIPRKNILALLESAEKCRDYFDKLYVVGDGPLRPQVEQIAEQSPVIEFLGHRDNAEVYTIMQGCDLLILPSIFDGWGAVVNEAIQAGMQVLCSDACGAASLLDGECRGGTFFLKTPGDLEKQLKYWCRHERERHRIAAWAKEAISSHQAVRYFMEIIGHIDHSIPCKPTPPWK